MTKFQHTQWWALLRIQKFEIRRQTKQKKKCYPHSPKRSVTFKWVSRINYPIPSLWFSEWLTMAGWLATKTRKRKPIKISRLAYEILFFLRLSLRSLWLVPHSTQLFFHHKNYKKLPIKKKETKRRGTNDQTTEEKRNFILLLLHTCYFKCCQ